MTDDIQAVSRFVPSQGLSIHYSDWGNAGAPPLVLLHGNRDHGRSWDWTAQRLRGDHHVVAMDLRGHGDSDWSADGGYLMPYHVLDLAEVIDAIGPGPVSLVGHSFGGSVCWRYAALYPERVAKLVIVDGLGPDPRARDKWDEIGPVNRLRDWVERRRDPGKLRQRTMATIEEAAARMAASNAKLSAEQAHHLALHGARPADGGYVWKYDPRVAMFTPDDFAIPGDPYWQAVAAPTLLYYGAESWTSNPETDGRARNFRDHRTIVYPDAGHWVHHDHFDDFAESLKAFVSA